MQWGSVPTLGENGLLKSYYLYYLNDKDNDKDKVKKHKS